MLILAIAALYIAADLALGLTKAFLEKRVPNHPGSFLLPQSPLECFIMEAPQDKAPTPYQDQHHCLHSFIFLAAE